VAFEYPVLPPRVVLPFNPCLPLFASVAPSPVETPNLRRFFCIPHFPFVSVSPLALVRSCFARACRSSRVPIFPIPAGILREREGQFSSLFFFSLDCLPSISIYQTPLRVHALLWRKARSQLLAFFFFVCRFNSVLATQVTPAWDMDFALRPSIPLFPPKRSLI